MEKNNQQLQGEGNNPDDEGSWDDASEEEEDDEATLDEEEALDQEDVGDEINALQEEQDIPVEELLKMYGYGGVSSSEVEPQAAYISSSLGLANQVATISSTSNDSETYAAVAAAAAATTTTTTVGLHSEHGYFSDVEDEQDEASDDEYIPHEALRREIRVGPEYQADVPSCTETGITPIENGTNEYPKDENDANDDLLLWKPNDADENKVVQFLLKAHEITAADDELNETNGSDSCQRKFPADDEAALRALMQSRYDPESALAEHHDEIASASRRQDTEMSEAEIQDFESGLETFGKNFRQIRAEKLPHRTVSELVRYYYSWKSTYRHELFASRMRLLRLQKQLEQQQATLNMAANHEAQQHGLYPEASDVFLHHIRGLDPQMTRNVSVGGELCSQSENDLNFQSHANATELQVSTDRGLSDDHPNTTYMAANGCID